MINIQLTYHGHPIYQICFLNTVMPVALTLTNIVILEGIMRANWYKPLFELAVQLYGTEVYSYYFDLPFEETLKRHQTRPICQEFGEDAMRSWWRDNDFSDVLNEVRITAEKNIESIVEDVYNMVSSH